MLTKHVKNKIIGAIKKSMKGQGPEGLALSEIKSLCDNSEGYMYYHIHKLLKTHPDIVGVGGSRNRRFIYRKNANDPEEWAHSRQFMMTDKMWNKLKAVVDDSGFANRTEFVLYAIEKELKKWDV